MSGDPRDETAFLRVPPHSSEAEQSVIGALLLDNQAWDRVGDMLTEADFYEHQHRLIYGVIGAMVNSLKAADVITVYQRLVDLGKSAECGGMVYLNAMVQSVPSSRTIRTYANIVREKAVERRLIAKTDEAATILWGSDSTVEKVDKVATLMRDIENSGRTDDKPTPIDGLVVELIDHTNDLHERGEPPGSPTGFKELDELLGGGWEKQCVYTLAARPSLGKSSLALTFGIHQALHLNIPTLIFTLEMGKRQFTARAVSAVGGVHGMRLKTGKLTDADWSGLSTGTEMLAHAPLWIDDKSASTVMDLRRKARSVPNVGFIVLDYLQLCGTTGKHDTRASAIGEISRATKRLAKELDCPFLQLSQLNRRVDERPGQVPQMSDLREAGDIEQDSDVVMFLRRHQSFGPEYDVMALHIGKNRDGPLGDLALGFKKPFNQWKPSTVDIHAKADPNASDSGGFE